MKIKTSELTGAALDWAVTRRETNYGESDIRVWRNAHENFGMFRYSTDWAHGGPIIEREKLSFAYNDFGQPPEPDKMYIGFVWNGRQHEDLAFGPTPLIAAMRCYVASKLGEYVDVPEELT